MNTHNDLAIDLAVKQHVNAPEDISVMEDCSFLASEQYALFNFTEKVRSKVNTEQHWDDAFKKVHNPEDVQNLYKLYQFYLNKRFSILTSM